MVAHIHTVSFMGIETLSVDVQVQLNNGLPSFSIVGLPDKAVGESKERVRGALSAMGLSLPAKRITVNLAPADMMKEGSHFDLPIALGVLVAMDILDRETLSEYVALGELGLDGRLTPVNGILPAAIHAGAHDLGLICPLKSAAEAKWAGDVNIMPAGNLISLINYLKGSETPPPIQKVEICAEKNHLDFSDIKGQESAKRAMEITAAGGHNVLMCGPPGAGKSMLAARMPTILPPMDSEEMLEISMIKSVAGLIEEGKLVKTRPFRDPHHSASMASIIGGGMRAKPGEISLAHGGVLFLDELPEFQRAVLESLRQPLETGYALIARANIHVTYPAKFQLIGAMNPCKCGYLGDPHMACSRVPKCGEDYQNKLSGPFLDRIDIHIDVPNISPHDIAHADAGDNSETILNRVAAARAIQKARIDGLRDRFDIPKNVRTNSDCEGGLLEHVTKLDAKTQDVMLKHSKHLHLSARAYFRILRVARTIADLSASENIQENHLLEALSYRNKKYKMLSP